MYKVERLSNENDIKKAMNIRFKVFVDEQKVPKELEIDELDYKKTTIHVGLFKDKEMLATGRILFDSENVIHLGRIAVLKEYRNKGLGKKLIIAMENIARKTTEKNIKSHLSSQLSAEKFYEKLGYARENNKIYLDAGIEHIDMQKEL